jgi:shikimate kinase
VTPKVVLVGLPGAGKSTVGRRLAKILVAEFADTDELIEAAQGRRVPEIFAADGEPGFRAIEARTIAGALRDFDGVLAFGGGALTDSGTRARLADSGIPVAWLVAPLETLVERVGEVHGRPLLDGDPAARLADLAAERGPVYETAATLTVHTEHRTPGQVAAFIAARLHEREVTA